MPKMSVLSKCVSERMMLIHAGSCVDRPITRHTSCRVKAPSWSDSRASGSAFSKLWYVFGPCCSVSAHSSVHGGALTLRCRMTGPQNLQTLRLELQSVYEAGIRSVAVCLMHSYTFFDHELAIGRLAREMGFAHVSLSHEVGSPSQS